MKNLSILFPFFAFFFLANSTQA